MVNELKEDIMTMSHQIKIIKKDTEIIFLKEQNGMSETWNYNNWNEKLSQRVSAVDSVLAEETMHLKKIDGDYAIWWRTKAGWRKMNKPQKNVEHY